MPYVINKTSGEPLLTLEDGVLNTSTSVGLVGRNYVGYGETQNENFLHLLENFANTNAPPRPIIGQNWFDTENNLLKIYNGQNWLVVGSAIVSETEPSTPSVGSIWLKIPSKVVFVYDGSNWQVVGPESAEGFGTTRARSTILFDSQGRINPVILVTIDEKVVSVISQREFIIGNQNPIEGFSRVFPGINMNSQMKFYGDLTGLAQRASRLDSQRTINGVGFNGESDITIKSATEEKLKRGTYLVGIDFDGSTEATWSVDASSSNIIGKVVVRDSTGSFSAGTITADVFGNLTGNVTANSGTSSFDIVTANQFIGANLSGNSRTATQLQNPRKINQVFFDGTQDITVPAAANTLTGNSLSSSVLFSDLTQTGTLISLSVTNNGIAIGDGGQLRINISDQRPTISTAGTNIPLRIRISDTQFSSSAGIDIIPSSLSLALGGENLTSIVPSSSLNIGHPSRAVNKVYANDFVGNLTGQADTSLVSIRSNSISGGSAGFIPYQTATNQTSFVPAGAPGQVLRSGGSGEPTWGSINFAPLEIGQYLTGLSYNGVVSTIWSVDADVNNTSNKVVVRDNNGNFAAGTITANLNGNASSASRLLNPRAINGVAFDGTANITIQATDPTKAPIVSAALSGAPTAPTPPTADNSNRIATTAFVKSALIADRPFYAGVTTVANIAATYSGFPSGTRVSFLQERVYGSAANSNGGTVSISDLYRRTIQKQPSGSWVDVG
jgi:hypothetical protein